MPLRLNITNQFFEAIRAFGQKFRKENTNITSITDTNIIHDYWQSKKYTEGDIIYLKNGDTYTISEVDSSGVVKIIFRKLGYQPQQITEHIHNIKKYILRYPEQIIRIETSSIHKKSYVDQKEVITGTKKKLYTYIDDHREIQDYITKSLKVGDILVSHSGTKRKLLSIQQNFFEFETYKNEQIFTERLSKGQIIDDTNFLKRIMILNSDNDEPTSHEKKQEEDSFDLYQNLSDQPKITKELLSNPNFRPIEKIIIQDRIFYISKVLKGPHREYAVMYTKITDKNGNIKIVARAIYKSNSDGGWRVTPGYDPKKKVYSKGFGFNYTQETKLAAEITSYLDNQKEKLPVTNDIVEFYFSYINYLNDMDTLSYFDEIKKFDDNGVLKKFKKTPDGKINLKPGHMSQVMIEDSFSFSEYFQNLDFSSDEMQNFIPNFDDLSVYLGTNKQNHTILGEINIDKFKAQLNGEPIIWHIAYDTDHRVWIDKIELENSKISSYGTNSVIIDSGLLTNKPIEYRKLSGSLTSHEYAELDNPKFKKYVDITPLLDNLEPIKRFRKFKNLYRNNQQ